MIWIHIASKKVYKQQEAHKLCSVSLMIRELWIKIIIKYHYNPLEWLKLKRLTLSTIGEHNFYTCTAMFRR